MRSAVQIPPLTKHPPTEVSCSTWVKNTEDSNCSQKALGNCAVSTVSACVVCGTFRSQRCNRCCFCNSSAPLRELRVGDTFRDRRQPRHRNAAPGGAAADHPQNSQPVPREDPLDDSPLPNCSHSRHWLHRTRQAATRRASPSLRDGTPDTLRPGQKS